MIIIYRLTQHHPSTRPATLVSHRSAQGSIHILRARGHSFVCRAGDLKEPAGWTTSAKVVTDASVYILEMSYQRGPCFYRQRWVVPIRHGGVAHNE